MNRSKILAFIIIFVAVVGVLVFFITKENSDTNNQNSNNSNTNQSTNNPDSTQNSNTKQQTTDADVFTKEEVSKHNTSSDCWTIIDEKVYNLTSYIPRHDGGDEILRACGIDGTTLFTERKTAVGDDVGTGTPHSSQAEGSLKSLQIGIVSN